MWAIPAQRLGDLGRSLLLSLCLVAPSQANLVVPADGAMVLSGGTTDLGCTDVAINGLVDLGSGTYFNVRNVFVGPSGVVERGSIRYSGKLTIEGSIVDVQLIASSPTDVACPGGVVAAVTPIPTMGKSMLAALAMLLLLPALVVLRARGARRNSEANGVKP